MEQNEIESELNYDISKSEKNKEDCSDILKALTITVDKPETSSLGTSHTKKPKKLEKAESIEVLDFHGGEDSKLLRSPLKPSTHLNGSSPQLTLTTDNNTSLASPSSPPPTSPKGSPKFVKFRNKTTTPNAAFQRRAEKAASVYGEKLQSSQKKQRPRSSIFGASAIMKRPTRHSLHATNLTLLNILENKKMKAAFMEFLESEYSSENLCFWLSCEKFKKLKSEEQRTKEGQYIYSQFISPNALHQVNIDHIMRRQITMAVMAEDPFPLDVFDSAKRYVFSIMENDSFPRFLTSPQYKDTLSGRKSPLETVISNILPGSWNSSSGKSQTKVLTKNTNNNNSKTDEAQGAKVARRFSFGLKKNPTLAVPKATRSSAPEICAEQFLKVDVKVS